LGVSVSASSAKAALGEAGARMNRLIAALKGAGIADRDIATAEINLSPQYAYQQGEAPRLTGYQASERIEAKVHDLARLGAIIDAAVAAGATDVGSVRFSLSDPTDAEDEARSRAVAALKARAELYGRLLGEPDVRLVRLSEAGAGESPPPIRPMMAASARLAPTPIEPGETTVMVSVSAEFQLSR
ncbi:MAG: SIMPL domain-containing protein, partial [Caulobacteraceae bacterium]